MCFVCIICITCRSVPYRAPVLLQAAQEPQPQRGVLWGMERTKRNSTNLRMRFKPPEAGTGFLEEGGGLVRHLRILLIRAGDVETNPGPRCLECGGVIRKNNKPVRCEECEGDTHAGCTGLTRRKLLKGVEGYRCGACRGKEQQPPVEEARDA